MITGFFLQLLLWLVGAVINVLPNAKALPAGFQDAVTLIATQLSAFSWLLPVYSLINAVIFVVAFDALVLLFRLSVWVLKIIRPH